jgi:ribosome biogenesis GTPase A
MVETDTMRFDISRFCLSHCLDKHPMLEESAAARKKYLNVLEFFIEKHSPHDVISNAIIKNYKNKMLIQIDSWQRDKKNDIVNLKYILKTRFRWFKSYTFRYLLLCDLIMMICPASESKAGIITEEIKAYIKNNGHKNKIDKFFQMLFRSGEGEEEFCLTGYHLDCRRGNNAFLALPARKIIISSNMSSGKSTLINAVTGKRINRSMNEACTSKLHYVYDKAYEDNYIYEYDHDLEMDAGIDTLMNNNPKNKENRIYVVSYFRGISDKHVRLCLIDSPGVNNSLDKTREETKHAIVTENCDIFVYVVNAEYIGTTDDYLYLSYIKEKLAKKTVVFVLNKLDKFRIPEDNIAESINNLREFAESTGYKNPVICPVSAYAGFMAKRALFDGDLSDDDREEYELLLKKFSRDEYDLSRYYDAEIIATAKQNIGNTDKEHKDAVTLLYNRGLLCLETILYQGEDK